MTDAAPRRGGGGRRVFHRGNLFGGWRPATGSVCEWIFGLGLDQMANGLRLVSSSGFLCLRAFGGDPVAGNDL